MSRRFTIAAVILFCFSICVSAQSTLKQIQEDPLRAAFVFHVYETFGTTRTDAPEGFVPFYISHYGRHGSRYSTTDSDFNLSLDVLRKCHEAGLLTPDGEKLLKDVDNIAAQHEGMYGILTQKGSVQHQQISERMFRNFPEVFKQNDRREVYAVSSPIQRCIQSMANFCTQLKGNSTGLNFHYYTGERYLSFLAYHPEWTPETKDLPEKMKDAMLVEGFNTERLEKKTFTDPDAARRLCGVNPIKFFEATFRTAAIAQNLDDEDTPDILTTYFTPRELSILCEAHTTWLYGLWCRNKEVGDYITEGTGAPLLKDIIAKADRAVKGNDVAADLRFGHDSGLTPLLSFIKVREYDKSLPLARCAKEWKCYREMCMGSNFQMIFYRNARGEVLVKMLHNERETSIEAVPAFSGPYYKWTELRKYFLSLLPD
ncbi:MAG: histidine phosphatase family protein [Bacteroidales bacterium]|nr:histidine phosphatase family protein [Bacteroidales bacterium]